MKKYLLFVITISLLCASSFFGSTAFAANKVGDSFTYNYTDNDVIVYSLTYTITKVYSSSTDYGEVKVKMTGAPTSARSIVIPQTPTWNYSGTKYYNVTAIEADGFKNSTYLTGVTIPSSVTSVGSSAFEGCTSLAYISFSGTSVTSWPASMCKGCTSLTKIGSTNNRITIYSAVTSIGSSAFEGCTSITSVLFSGTSVTSFASSVFKGCSSLTTMGSTSGQVIIPNYVTTINASAFANCTGITKLTIGTGITTLNSAAFTGCTNISTVTWKATNCTSSYTTSANPFSASKSNITSFTFENGVTKIPSFLCYQLTEITSVTIPQTVTFAGGGAFGGCSKLTNVVWNAANCADFTRSYSGGIPTYSSPFCQGAASGARIKAENLTTITFGANVTHVPADICLECSKLKVIIWEAGKATIGTSAFGSCDALKSVIWNKTNCDDFESASATPFYSIQTQIESFTFKNSVTLIPAYLCDGMTNLKQVSLPSTVTTIGANAFNGCTGMEVFACAKTTAPTAAASSFTDVPCCLTVPADSWDSYKDATGWSHFNNAGCSNAPSDIVRGTCGAQGKNLIWELNLTTGAMTISGTGEMANYSSQNAPWYQYRSSITQITIEEGVTSIGEYAFYYCQSAIFSTLPKSLVTIGKEAFWHCDAVTEFLFAEASELTTIGSYAFDYCISLEHITIPEKVVSFISANAFDGCTSLISVTWNARNCPDFGSSTTGPFNSKKTNIQSFEFGPAVEHIPSYLCSGMNNAAFTSIAIPESVTSIGANAFYGCSSLTDITWNAVHCEDFTSSTAPFDAIKANIQSVTFGSEVEHIPAYLCYQMNNAALTTITIPLSNKITTIGYSAFRECASLTSCTIPEGITAIGDDAFRDCSNLASITWNARSCTKCLNSSGGQSNLNYSTNPFYGTTRSAVTSFTFGDNVEDIPSGLCYNMNNASFTSIIIGSNVESIGASAFENCTGLTSINMRGADHLASIGSAAFDGCGNVVGEIYIPASVNTVNANIFNDFSKVTSMCVMPTSVPTGATSTSFANMVKTIPVYFASTDYTTANYWKDFTNYTCSGYCGAEEGGLNLTWTYTNSNNTLTISGTGAMADYNTSDNRAPWYDLRSEITKLVIEEGVTTIGLDAFYAAYNFEEISLPASLKESKSASFATIVGASLGRVNYAGTIDQWCDIKFGALSSTPMNYGTPAFYANGSQISGTVTIPEGVDSIKSYTLINLGITNLNLPTTLEYMGSSAFDKNAATLTNIYYAGSAADWCGVSVASSTSHPLYVGRGNDPQLYCNSAKPTSVVVPNGVTSLSDYHFYNCENLTSVTISKDITEIGAHTFDNSALTTVVWNATNCPNFTSNTYAPFNNICTQITSVSFGSNVKNIPGYLCYGMNNASLTSISIPNSVTSIGNYAFKNCSNLTTISIGEESSLTTLGNNVFENCAKLTAIYIPNGLTALPKETFLGCSKLATVTYGDAPTLATIGQFAFKNCTTLTSITIPTSVTSIDCNAGQSQIKSTFYGCSGLRTVVWNAAHCSNFTYAYYNGNSHNYYTPFYDVWANITSFTFGPEVTSLPAYLCHGMSNLATITSWAETPPTVANANTWTSVPANATVNVLCLAVETAYKEYANWARFTGTWNHLYLNCGTLEIETDQTLSDVAPSFYGDITVKEGATLTMDDPTSLDLNIKNLTIEPTARIELEEGATYSIKNLIMQRSGDEDDDNVATAQIKGSLTADNLILDFTLDDSRWFPISLPQTIAANSVKVNGVAQTPDEDYFALSYQGDQRAERGPNSDNWEWVANSGSFEANKGYLIGLPGGTHTLRFTMPAYTFNETDDKSVSVNEYAADKPKDAGWNFVGNPYLQAYHNKTATMTVESEQLAAVVAAVVAVSADGEYIVYEETEVSEAIIPPFSAMFIQSPATGSLVFDNSSARKNSPVRRQQTAETTFLQLTLAGNGASARTNFLVNDDYDESYRIGADLVKWFNDNYQSQAAPTLYSFKSGDRLAFNARSEEMMTDVPVGFYATTDGAYTFSLTNDAEQFEHVLLRDHELNRSIDLKTSDYEFQTAAGTVDTRFTISATLAKQPEIVTDINTINDKQNSTKKIIKDGHLYILHGEDVYTSTGQKVQ